MRRIAFVIASCLVTLTPALAQTPREAISVDLSPADVAAAFEDAALSACAPAIAEASLIAGLPPDVRRRFVSSSDVETSRISGAAPSDAVFDVLAGKGVVTVREGDGRCIVSAYGPPASPTIRALAARLSAEGFERLAAAGPTGLSQSLVRFVNGRRVQAILSGSEPGMPGHQSRFSVVTATFFATPG
ncbi:MAG: hypothetical protein SGJ21_14675 [Alphaproteobacteria bacterium]|nr:hypothetical protein [Alphaproteobacteria bacterium]